MNKVFGREKVIESIWNLLINDSILFTAERRVGKTTVLNELLNKPKDGYRVIYSDLEKVDSPLEFINDLLNKTTPFVSPADRASGWFFKLRDSLNGYEIRGLIKIPDHKEKDWKQILQVTINAICNNTDDIVVFLWDELPYMLQKINGHEIANNSAEKSSLKIMDTLRALRQEQNNLRMIFTGSIGLHHVLHTLTDDTYTSEPVNNMQKVALLPLDPAPAKEMAHYHLKKELGIPEVDEKLIECIALHCDFIPFYIEKLVRRLTTYDATITVSLVDQEIASILTDANDDWELEHFRSRLGTYYKGDITDTNDRKIKRSAIAKSILNHCAVSSSPQSINQCYQTVKSSYSIDNRDLIIATLNNLVKDHYLQRNEQGNYRFYFSLVQRWWLLAEGLNTLESSDHA